jgi:diguanylate cyclase (GGDEF)-like protein
MPRLTLRAKLALLNIIVAVALLLLAVLGWRMSGLQDDAQARQIELSQALAQAKQADMVHDALRSDVMASLLIGVVPSMTRDDAVRDVANDSGALDDAIEKVAATKLPPALTKRVARIRELVRTYGGTAVQLVKLAGEDRSTALAALPGFQAQFNVLMRELAAQSKELGAVLDQAKRDGAAAAESQRQWITFICAVTVALASAVVAIITMDIRRRLTELGRAAQLIADGDLDCRANDSSPDELGKLGSEINRMAINLSGMIDEMRGEARRATFGHKLADALEMADREQHVSVVSARAMAKISQSHPMELLISDSSRAQMERAVEHPLSGAPGCGVSSPYDCVAVRRGSVVTFENSDALNACAQLCGRSGGPMSAVCVPVTFMGRAIGVLHATGAVDKPLSSEQAQQLGTLGAQLGVRIGTVRAFEKTQIQAATDALTGLSNRRSVEQRLHSITASGEPYALVMCDLDRFKLLNDTHGHATGDTALRVFTDVMRTSVREGDLAGRWGGEEFIMVLCGCDARAALEIVDRMRAKLAATLKLGKTPVFTASFGIADSSMSGQSQDLIQFADGALYQAKSAGRDRACITDLSHQATEHIVRRAELSGVGLEAEAMVSISAES